jgi:hypothetical protein
MIKTDDPRLQSILPLVNGCCNPYAWSPQDVKDAFNEAWQAFEVKSATLDPNDPVIVRLIEVLKNLAHPRVVLSKRELIRDKWIPLKAELGL